MYLNVLQLLLSRKATLTYRNLEQVHGSAASPISPEKFSCSRCCSVCIAQTPWAHQKERCIANPIVVDVCCIPPSELQLAVQNHQTGRHTYSAVAPSKINKMHDFVLNPWSSWASTVNSFKTPKAMPKEGKRKLMRVGFEPTPFRTTDNRCFKGYETLTWRLRPLGHLTIGAGRFSAVTGHLMGCGVALV